jgi:hypothetical protein
MIIVVLSLLLMRYCTCPALDKQTEIESTATAESRQSANLGCLTQVRSRQPLAPARLEICLRSLKCRPAGREWVWRLNDTAAELSVIAAEP